MKYAKPACFGVFLLVCVYLFSREVYTNSRLYDDKCLQTLDSKIVTTSGTILGESSSTSAKKVTKAEPVKMKRKDIYNDSLQNRDSMKEESWAVSRPILEENTSDSTINMIKASKHHIKSKQEIPTRKIIDRELPDDYEVNSKDPQNIESMTKASSANYKTIWGKNASSSATKVGKEQDNRTSKVAEEDSLGDSGTGQLCAQKSRVSLYKSVCSKYDAYQPNQSVTFGALDFDRNTFGCLIGKAGSTSWTNFLVRSKVPDYNDKNFRDREFLKSVGLKLQFSTPIANMTDDYNDWTKYIIVRHPLQRVVSAYFHSIIKLGCCLKPDNTSLTFLEFVEGFASGDFIDSQSTWKRYVKWCKVCDVDYQFVVKQETLNQDTERFKKLLDLETDPSMAFRNVNRNVEITTDETDIHYKYDEMLGDVQDKHPELMRGLLKAFELDMELFGYGWNWDKRKSYCKDKSASGCC